MGYRIVGDNVDYTLPSSVDIRDLSLSFQQSTVKLPGRFGVIAPTIGYPQGGQTLEVVGLIKSDSATNLATEIQNFARAFNSGSSYRIEDTTLNRWAIGRTIGFAHSRPPSGAKVIRIRVRILLVEGAWRSTSKNASQGVTFESNPDSQTKTFSLTDDATFVGLLSFNYAGSVPVPPVITFTLNSGVTWTPSLTFKGGNLLRNASFEGGSNQPDGWSYDDNPKPTYGEARTGRRSMRVSTTDYIYQDLYVNVADYYAFSAYFKPVSAAVVPQLQVDWLSSTDGVISSSTGTDDLNSTDEWQRMELTAQAPANTVKARCRLETSGGTTAYADDAQFENVATAGTAFPFVDPIHIVFSRNAALTGTDWSEYAIDMVQGTVRLMDSSNAWTDDLGAMTGQFFELQPGEGRQHIEVNPPSGTDLPASLWYQTRHIW